MTAISTNPYKVAAQRDRARKLALLLATPEGRAHGLGLPLADWPDSARENLARDAGLATPPSAETWALTIEFVEEAEEAARVTCRACGYVGADHLGWDGDLCPACQGADAPADETIATCPRCHATTAQPIADGACHWCRSADRERSEQRAALGHQDWAICAACGERVQLREARGLLHEMGYGHKACWERQAEEARAARRVTFQPGAACSVVPSHRLEPGDDGGAGAYLGPVCRHCRETFARFGTE